MNTRRKEIFIVSKPLAPPWNDSGKNLVRDIMAHLPGERFRAFVPRGTDLEMPHVVSEDIYPSAGSFAPALAQNLRLFARLLRPGRRPAIYHFFFAPNPRSSQACRLIRSLKRRPCVQNISSRPKDLDDIGGLIFGDRVVVHSDYMKSELVRRGVRNVSRIFPGIAPPVPPGAERRRKAEALVGGGKGPLILYPGDYIYSGSIPALTAAIPSVLARHPEARFIFACRIKTPEDRDFERRMVAGLESAGVRKAVVIINDVPDFLALVSLCDLVAFPAVSLYAKMDIPLALLECLGLGKPLVVTDFSPLKEVLTRPSGILIPPDDPEALSAALNGLLGDERRRLAMGREGVGAVNDEFNIGRLASGYADIYRELRNEKTV